MRFGCLCLPPTQQALLEKEQSVLRQIASLERPSAETLAGVGAPVDWLPFNPLPPFCPAQPFAFCGKIRVAAPEARLGWVIRAASWATSPNGEMADRGAMDAYAEPTISEGPSSLDAPPIFPGYPALPVPALDQGEGGVFILGWAGEGAQRLVERLTDQEADAREFTVNVCLFAELSVEIEWQAGAFYRAYHEYHSPRWARAARG